MSSKYEPLGDYLSDQTVPTVTLTFRQIEKILGFALPEAARRHAAWWANGAASRHGQAKAWTSAGRKARPHLTSEAVEFSRRSPGSPRGAGLLRGAASAARRGEPGSGMKVAAEVWVATALLHREFPKQADFEIHEIVERAKQENIAGQLRPGVYQHVVTQAVANRPPGPGRYCYLSESAPGRRRLYRPGDRINPERRGAAVLPPVEDLPGAYRSLLDWYRATYAPRHDAEQDPILALSGLGKHLWKDVDPDEYVRQLREEWDS